MLDTAELVTLGIASGALLLNGVTAYLLIRGIGPDIRIVHLPSSNTSPDREAAGGTGPAVSGFNDAVGGRCDGDRGAGFQAMRQGHLPQEVPRDRAPPLREAAVLQADFGDRHCKVAGVDDLNAVCPQVSAGQVDGHEADAQTNRIAPNHPPSIEHAQRCADDGDGEGGPSERFHADESTSAARPERDLRHKVAGLADAADALADKIDVIRESARELAGSLRAKAVQS